jgi:hypothetical protein
LNEFAPPGQLDRYVSFSLAETMRRIFTILVVALGPLLFTESAAACSCESSGSDKTDFAEARDKAKSIFVGRAVAVEDVIAHGGFSEKRVTLRVDRYWKGKFHKTVIVFSGRNDCETHFVVGEEYLVLAYVPDSEHDLYTDHCLRSGLLRLSADSLKWLGEGKRSQPSRAKHNNSLDAGGISGLVIDNLSVTQLTPAASTQTLGISS